MDEETLQSIFSTGDESCLAAAIALYGQPLLGYCHHILCDYHEAQDAVQSTFIKAWSRRRQFHGGSLKAWLYRLAYTTSIDQLRRRKRQLFSPPPAPPTSNPDYIGEELGRALAVLSPEERALVFVRVMEELSFEELAQRHSCPAATLRKQYQRAREKLSAALAMQEVPGTGIGEECSP